MAGQEGYEGIGLPGIGTIRTAVARQVVLGNAKYYPSGRTIQGASARDPLNSDNPEVLEAGLIMGMISATKLLAPSCIGLVTTTLAQSGTSLLVSVATATEVLRRNIANGNPGTTGNIQLVGPATNGGAVNVSGSLAYTAINVGAGTITLASGVATAFVAGSWVTDVDGSHIPMTLIDEPCGIRVVDANYKSIDVEGRLLIQAHLDANVILNWPVVGTFPLFNAWIKLYLRASGFGYTFTDDWGL
jgi:hypothetical protein